MELKLTLAYCPHCGEDYKVRSFMVGQLTTCTKCHKSFTMTAAPDQRAFQRKAQLVMKRLSALLYPGLLIAWLVTKQAWPLVAIVALLVFHFSLGLQFKYAQCGTCGKTIRKPAEGGKCPHCGA